MKLKVNKDKCTIIENEIWNVGDYNVHTVQVELSPEFNGLVNKVRYFVENNSYDMLITDNVAQVPYEATVMVGTIKIGVYGYDADTDILVQSTSPVNKYITSGTYTGDPDNTQPLTPTDKEQMETVIQKNTNDITDLKENKQDKLISGVNIKTINNESILSSGNLTLVEEEADPIFTNSPAYSITDNDITYWNNKANISDIPDVSNFITKDVDNLTYYELKTNTGSLIDLEINDSTYVVTLKLKNSNGTTISTDTIDLPLESVVVGGSYDSETKEVVLSLEGGSEVRFSVADLVSGLQSEITSSNKLDSDLVNDENQTNKFVTASDITTWNNKLDSSDLTNYVTNTDYASSSTAGVIKVSNANAIGVSSIGTIFPSVLSYLQYKSGGDWMFIGKGTLENVITGKGLIDSSSDITGNASTSTTLKTFNYNRNGTNYTWAKVATTSLVKTWEEKHAYLFVKGTHSTNFKQNGIISIDAVGNAIKSKVNSYSAQFISASTDLNVENFYIEYQDGDANTNATINFWVKNTTSAYATWQFKILQNTGWTIESAYTSVTTLPTQDFTGKISELNNKTLNDKDGNDITTTYAKNTDYATSVTGGVVKTGYSINVDTNGNLYVESKSYSDYDSMGSNNAISKGTLENVITGRALENKYSMSEIKTGTWIDNKPVYRRVFTINLGAAPNIAQAHSLTNLDKFWINQSASFVFSSNESLPSTWYYSSTDWARTWMTNTTIRFRSPGDLTNRVLWVVVEYTKTTD